LCNQKRTLHASSFVIDASSSSLFLCHDVPKKNTLHRRDYALLLAAFIDAGDVCAGRRVLNHGRGASQSYLQQTNQPAAALLLWLTMR